MSPVKLKQNPARKRIEGEYFFLSVRIDNTIITIKESNTIKGTPISVIRKTGYLKK